MAFAVRHLPEKREFTSNWMIYGWIDDLHMFSRLFFCLLMSKRCPHGVVDGAVDARPITIHVDHHQRCVANDDDDDDVNE